MKIRKLKSAEDVKKFLDSSKTVISKLTNDIDGILRGKYACRCNYQSSKKSFGYDIIFGWV